MTESPEPNPRRFLPQIPDNLASAYIAASQLDSTMKSIQEQAAMIARGIEIATPIIEQNQEMTMAMVRIANAARSRVDFSRLVETLDRVRPHVIAEVNLTGSGTLTATVSPSLLEVVEEARQAQAAFAGTELESDLADLLSEDDRASVDQQISHLDLADPATKALLSWYIGIVIGMLYLVLILDMSEAIERYSTVLEIVGLPSVVGVTKRTAQAARKALDSGFPTEEEG